MTNATHIIIDATCFLTGDENPHLGLPVTILGGGDCLADHRCTTGLTPDEFVARGIVDSFGHPLTVADVVECYELTADDHVVVYAMREGISAIAA